MVTFADIFCGIGGFRLALESLGATCVFSSDIDKYACETYRSNFNDMPRGDITKINSDNIPDFDILCAGFPCQPFSQAGLNRGLGDNRSNLFDDIIRIAKHKQPKILFLENVKGLVSHNKGRTLKILLLKIKELGYFLDYRVLKASDYGLPTFRPRLYIIAFKNQSDLLKFSWPKPMPLQFTMSDVLNTKCDKEIGYTIRNGGRGGDINDRHNWQKYKVNDGIRTLTVDEMKLMMGFPKDFKFPVSKTQAMKQIGNSVAINVIYNIGKQLIPRIRG